MAVGCAGGTEAGMVPTGKPSAATYISDGADEFRHGSSQTAVGCAGGIEAGLVAPTGTRRAQGDKKQSWSNPEDDFRHGTGRMTPVPLGGA